jgi:hypothetical protein
MYELHHFIKVAIPDQFHFQCTQDGSVIFERKNFTKHELIFEMKYAKYSESKEVINC